MVLGQRHGIFGGACRIGSPLLVLAIVSALIMGSLTSMSAAAADSSTGGPVILGGDDMTDHGYYDAGSGLNYQGWLYLQNALASVAPQVTRSGADGSIAALGSVDPIFDPASSYSADAGAAIASAAAANGMEVNYYSGDTEMQTFFEALESGSANPSVIWIAGSDSSNDLGSNGGQAALTASAGLISAFVRSGGGLVSHGVEYGWLGELLPGVVMGCDGGSSGDLELTARGQSAFPDVTVDDVNAGPWHGCFEGDIGDLEVLVRSNSMTSEGGAPAPVIIGGSQVFIEPDTYTALGDSYSAGEGVGSYSTDTETDNNKCHRSSLAYGPKLNEQLSLGQLSFAACSGALTQDFLRANHSNPTEPRQLRAVTSGTDNVTFTIGGNDVGFAQVLDRCIKTPRLTGNHDYGCSEIRRLRERVAARTGALGGGPAAVSPDGTKVHSIAGLLQRVHNRAPSSFTVVAGYPQLFGTTKRFYFAKPGAPSGYACDVGRGALQATVDFDDAQWLNGRAVALNRVLRDSVERARDAGVPVRFVNPTQTFGNHRFCGAENNWFFPLRLDGTKPWVGSFHPTAAGQEAYRDAISGLPRF